MKSTHYLLAAIWGVILWGCQSGTADTGDTETAYFPINEYVKVYADKLEGKELNKEINLNGELERSTSIPDAEQWLREFDFFLQADINRPSLVSSYETQRSEEYLIHELRANEKAKVKKMVVRYYEGRVKEISFLSQTKNPFYTSKTRGVMIFHGVTGEIIQYNVETIQEMMFSKPNKMIISASVQ